MTDVLGVVAASWGVLMAISPILQIRRMLDQGSSADISIIAVRYRAGRDHSVAASGGDG